MINENELELRKQFESMMATSHPLMSLAWDTDHDEYVYDDAEQMFQGWILNIREMQSILNRAITRLEIETAVKTAIVKWQLSEHGGEAEKTGYDHIVDEVMRHVGQRDFNDIPDDQLIGILTARWKLIPHFVEFAKPFIQAMATPSATSGREAVEAELRIIDRLIHYETVAPWWTTLSDITGAIERARKALAALEKEGV